VHVSLKDEGKRKTKKIHRFVAKAFLPNPSCFTEVNHIDGNKTNNHVGNLEWVTKIQNEAHAYKVLGKGVGSKKPNSKLTEEKVIQIRSQKDFKTQKQLSIEFGVSESTVFHILKGTVWKHI
jgi:hypothetical protein